MNGNRGGLSGADATCLTDLTNNAWVGKASAGALTGARVKAFLCDSTTCNNLQASTVYNFASTYASTAGGATFTTDGSGAGPGNSDNWNDSSHFGLPTLQQVWTGRGTNTASLWSTSGSGSNCNDWSNSTGGQQGTAGRTDTTTGTRWSNSTYGCNTNLFLICAVAPE